MALLFEQPALQPHQDPGQATGHLHLGNAEPLAKLNLRLLAEVAPVKHFPVIRFQFLDGLVEAHEFFKVLYGLVR
jgi:hypothetical protein